ncbi:MAG: aspartate ammonia-lyase, partial [Duodenibacillus sp.]|nr:aspartate ammonia-lyase [Duodenibacillus sp.]
IKKACAIANAEIGAMKPEIARAIAEACDRVIAGGYEAEFPLDMWQGGGYTCVNMNVNEVIANMANEILTGHKGYDAVHPNTHVNMAQSTNDTIPSATHLAIAPRLDAIIAEVKLLEQSFAAKAEAFKDIVKVGRTCWQDALPVTLGQEFSGFASIMGSLAQRLEAVRPGCFELIMGGNAVGTGVGAEPGYMPAFYRAISKELGEDVRPAANLFNGFQNSNFVLQVSAVIKELACTLSKIAKDLRLMSSGPRAGWMEINLPACAPGSSIMPGKINPTVPEMVIQIAHQACGNDLAISMAIDEGELDLNVWDATFYKCLFENLQIVGGELPILRKHCVDGITANAERCRFEAETTIALSTVVAATFGYPEGVRVAHYAEEHKCSIKQAVLAMGLMNEEQADLLIDPALMAQPEKMAPIVARFKKELGILI